jgi:hypothetical protein
MCVEWSAVKSKARAPEQSKQNPEILQQLGKLQSVFGERMAVRETNMASIRDQSSGGSLSLVLRPNAAPTASVVGSFPCGQEALTATIQSMKKDTDKSAPHFAQTFVRRACAVALTRRKKLFRFVEASEDSCGTREIEQTRHA